MKMEEKNVNEKREAYELQSTWKNRINGKRNWIWRGMA